MTSYLSVDHYNFRGTWLYEKGKKNADIFVS